MRRLTAWTAGLALVASALLPAFGITVSQKLLFSFGDPPPSPTQPAAPVIQGADGKLYGTLSQGGSGNAGIVFRVNPDGTQYEIRAPSPIVAAAPRSPTLRCCSDPETNSTGPLNPAAPTDAERSSSSNRTAAASPSCTRSPARPPTGRTRKPA